MKLERDKSGGTTDTCNAGEVKAVEKGKFLLDQYLTVWYDKRFIGNVLAFWELKRVGDIEMIDEKFVVTWKDGRKWDFEHSNEFGFYYSDMDWHRNKHCDKHVLLASTVKDNKSQFTQRDVSKANTARNLEAI